MGSNLMNAIELREIALLSKWAKQMSENLSSFVKFVSIIIFCKVSEVCPTKW